MTSQTNHNTKLILANKSLVYGWYQDVAIPGNRLHHYKMHMIIGQGGAGRVWLAEGNTSDEKSTSKLYAIKEMSLNVANSEFEMNQYQSNERLDLLRFRKEIKLLMNLRHGAHIVKIK